VDELTPADGIIPWASVAELMGGHRTPYSYRGRWELYLTPGGVTHRPWTPAEDQELIQFPVRETKTPWLILGPRLNRHPKEVANRFHVLRRHGKVPPAPPKELHAAAAETTSTDLVDSNPV
jgi:hypothetical protein